MPKSRFFICPFVLTIALLATASAAELRLDVEALPDNGLLIRSLDFGPVLRWSNLDAEKIGGLELRVDGVKIPAQLAFDGRRGCLIARFPKECVERSKTETISCSLKLTLAGQPVRPVVANEIITETPVYRITQNINAQGGLPSKIEFKTTGRLLETHRWYDRLHHPDCSMSIADSKEVKLSLLSDGPICRVVRQEVVPFGSGTATPKTPPSVVYHWFFFKDSPFLIYVTADYSQPDPIEWKERHFLELHVADGSFGEYVDLEKPAEKKKFAGTKETLSGKGAALLDAPNRIAAFGVGSTTVYDGLATDFGPYLLANGRDAMRRWSEPTAHESAWLLLDAGETDFLEKGEHRGFEQKAGVRLSIPELDATAKTWNDVARNAMFYAGLLKTRNELAAVQFDGERFFAIQSDNLGMVFEKVAEENNQGVRLVAMVDIPSKKLLTPYEPQSLFTVKIREAAAGSEDGKPAYTMRNLLSDRGWKSVDVVSEAGEPNPKNGYAPRDKILLSFKGIAGIPGAESASLQLVVESHRKGTDSSVRSGDSMIEMFWNGNPVLPENLTLDSAVLPTIRLAAFGDRMKAFYPKASGVVLDRPFSRNLSWRDRYPSGWAAMPWYAVWDNVEKKDDQVGLYLAAHDKGGTSKELRIVTEAETGTVNIFMDYPAENQGRPDARFAPCRIALESFRGDWFDAAVLYRDWVRREASWYPRDKMSPDGRTDTPGWMKELSVWAIASAGPGAMPELIRKFQQPLGVPTGLHWYNWHQVPFDNDYPHYFPVVDGFKTAVADIQKDGDLFVMPYINGRLWDIRDRGMEDWLFTKQAFPGVTKKEDGTAYTETYNSKETDGSEVKLGVMCPASEVWTEKQREIIGRLVRPSDREPGDDGGMGVNGVYVDQVAAAPPKQCFDVSHGHPLGGGDWWVSAYRKMYQTIRSEFPEGAILTTECTAEPFVDVFDGYLTWHFQHDGQVPGFAAVYGGAIPMFGRSYGGGPDVVIASRMKMAESFVFGEQIGWITPSVVNQPDQYDFLKKIVALRYKFRDYFYKGELARPPKLSGEMPKVTADWLFCGNPTVVTLGIVQAGAWRKPAEKSVILLFANFADQPQTNGLQVDLTEWELDLNKTTVVRHNPDGSEQQLEKLPETVRLEAQDAFVLELRENK